MIFSDSLRRLESYSYDLGENNQLFLKFKIFFYDIKFFPSFQLVNDLSSLLWSSVVDYTRGQVQPIKTKVARQAARKFIHD